MRTSDLGILEQEDGLEQGWAIFGAGEPLRELW